MILSPAVADQEFAVEEVELSDDDADLAPYASLFMKPMSAKKSAFSKPELERMCMNPQRSPKLILYLINFVRQM